MKTHCFRLSILILLLAQACCLAAQNPPQRLISLAPNITEMIFKIGAGELLVGRTDYCIYPEAAQQIPSVGGYLNPNYEQIVSLRPDIIFMLPNLEMERKLQRLGLKTFTLPDETVEEIFLGFRALGRVLNRVEAAETAIAGIQDTLRRVQEQSAGRDSLASVLLLVGREAGSLKGLFSAGQNTYLSEILELCGGRNVFGDVGARYFDISKEDLVRRDPDAIIEFRMIDPARAEEEIARLKAEWEVLPTLKAVQRGKIFIFYERAFLIPGPRIGQLAMAMYGALQ